MLNPEDRNAIEGLFERLNTVAQSADPRDAEAEILIQDRLQQAPSAPYYMAQTILVQEHALRVAQEKIAELEAEVAQKSAVGGFLGGLFGDREQPSRNRQPQQRARGPWDRGEQTTRGNGGFLAGAAQTALGVTGGVLLGSAIAGMLTGGAQAEELPVEDTQEEPADNFDTGGDDDTFDIGGDF